MNEDPKVQIPDGYRWVELRETRGEDVVWKSQQGGFWSDTPWAVCNFAYSIITPIKPPKSETVDVEIFALNGFLHIVDPNTQYASYIHNVPCIVGPEWEFAGYVWEDGNHSMLSYYSMIDGVVVYAKAVRFRRVGGAK